VKNRFQNLPSKCNLQRYQAVLDGLPALLNNIKMMHTIARYYNTPERMTTLFYKVTNQMITNCKAYIAEGGNLWNQDKPALLENLKLAVKLEEKYKVGLCRLNQVDP
jgi:dynein heavy chain